MGGSTIQRAVDQEDPYTTPGKLRENTVAGFALHAVLSGYNFFFHRIRFKPFELENLLLADAGAEAPPRERWLAEVLPNVVCSPAHLTVASVHTWRCAGKRLCSLVGYLAPCVKDAAASNNCGDGELSVGDGSSGRWRPRLRIASNAVCAHMPHSFREREKERNRWAHRHGRWKRPRLQTTRFFCNQAMPLHQESLTGSSAHASTRKVAELPRRDAHPNRYGLARFFMRLLKTVLVIQMKLVRLCGAAHLCGEESIWTVERLTSAERNLDWECSPAAAGGAPGPVACALPCRCPTAAWGSWRAC
jgi:hypothetical protein